jgi:peptide chain release factor 1
MVMKLPEQTKAAVVAKLEALAARYREAEAQLADPEVASDPVRVAAVAQEHGRLGKFAERLARLQEAQRRGRDARESLADEDEELRLLAAEELEDAGRIEEQLMEEAVDLLLGEESEAGRNVILEVRAGTGGEEAALFAAQLCRMYTRYAERRGWKVELLDSSTSDLGGMKEAVLSVSGPDVWQRLRYESGGHRVQRVPETESQGRIHTSLATVAVLPEPREVEVEIHPEDIAMSFMRSSGPGGQHVNKTSSSVRLVHKPTGIIVRCQDEKSQQANRKKAMKILRAKLYDAQTHRQREERDTLRRSQVGSGDRNERVRTYNFPQDRVTDHRIGLDVFGIESFLMGECDGLLAALAEHDRQERIRALGASPTES